MSSIFDAKYFEAVRSALENGMIVLGIMLVLGFVFTVFTGGPAARNWKKADHSAH